MKELLFYVIFAISLFILLSSLLDAQNQRENFKQVLEGLTNNNDVTFGGNMSITGVTNINGYAILKSGTKWGNTMALLAGSDEPPYINFMDSNNSKRYGYIMGRPDGYLFSASTNSEFNHKLTLNGGLQIGTKAIIYSGADPFTNDGWVRLMAGDGTARWGGYNSPEANGVPAGAAGFGANSFFANMNYYFNNQQPIGSAIPSNIFTMYGSANQIRFGWSGVDAVTINASRNLLVGGSVQQNSDIRLKTNIEPLTNVISSIKKLNGVKFNFKTYPSNKKLIGLIAQDVEKVFPELVTTEESGDQIKSVSYSNMVGVLVEAVKEQQKMIEDQQKMINDLQASVKMLMSRLR